MPQKKNIPKHALHFFTAVILCLGILFPAPWNPPARAAEAGEPVRVACVGDSITYGFTSSNAALHSYPSQLQNLLGDGYEVSNYGKTGYTLMKSGDKPYWGTTEHTNSLNSNPDIVILMLGTNDSKAANWADKDNFLSDLKEMIQGYQELPSHPEIYVCTSPRMSQDYEVMETQSGLNNAVINNEIVPLQKQAAEETGCHLLDVNAFSQKGFTADDFTDYCHPTDVGYQKLANFICGELTGQEVSMEILDDADTPADGSGFSFQGSGWVSGTLATGSLNGGAGTEHYAVVTEENASLHSYEITFTGTRIQVYGHLSPNHGIVTYSIDGGEETEIDAYAASRSGSTLLYQASGLSNGVHTLTAVATGQKNASAQNACIQVDYAKVFTEKSCTCSIESLELSDAVITIPWNQDSAALLLDVRYTVSPCELTAHQNLKPELSFSITDAAEIAVFDSDTRTLTVSGPGTVMVSALLEIPGTGVSSRKDAVFEVVKEGAPAPVIPAVPDLDDSGFSESETEPSTDAALLPAAPTNPESPSKQTVKLTRPVLKVKKSGRRAKLSWKKNINADGYIIQMKTGKGKYKKIAAKKGKATSYTKKKLKQNTVYRFRIRSYKQNGSSKVYSAWSKPVKLRL